MRIVHAALMAATLVSAAIPVFAQSSDDAFHAEITEWVTEPCMEVAAALGVKEVERDSVEMGIKRTHIAQLMVASRDSATRDLARKMRASATWEERRAAYPLMLEICLAQVRKDAQ